jgi:uncharacterized membrane protein
MIQAKSIFKSKTFWIAVLQAIGGVAVTFSSAYPKVGVFLILKSLVDIALRVATEQPVGII